MGIYNGQNVWYSDGTSGSFPQTIYGGGSRLANSTDPFVAIAIGNEYRTVSVNGISKPSVVPQVQLTWGTPSNGTGVVGLRVVRNQDGFSEHSEDGFILYESYQAAGSTFSPNTSVLDGDSKSSVPPLVPGRYAYYTTWLLTSSDNSWHLASYEAIIVPKSHATVTSDGIVLSSSENKFLGLLPRIYTSDSGNALDEISTSTDIYRFLSGFAYTLDEIQTAADLLTKHFSGIDVNPNFANVVSQHLGLPILPNTSLKTQKKLIRQVPDVYQLRGTPVGLRGYISALTSYGTTVSEGPNLLVSVQDSSFYKTVGGWVAGTGVTLITDETAPNTASEKYSVNNSWTASVTTSSTSQTITLGVGSDGNQIFKAVPIASGASYVFSFYAKKTSATTSTITPSITWYDYKGSSISTSTLTAYTATTSWAKSTSSTITAPTGAVYAGITLQFSAANTYRIDMVQLADPSVTSYHEGGSAEIYLAPPKINFLKNPSFASPSSTPTPTAWTYSNITGSATYPTTTVPGIIDGSTMVQLNANTSSSAPFSMTQSTDSLLNTGQFYTFSLYGLNPTAATTVPINVTLSAIDAASNVLATKTTQTVLTGTAALNWQRLSVNLYVPPAYTTVTFVATVSLDPTRLPGSGVPSNYTLSFDCAQIEYGYTYTDFFDGDFINRGASWVGGVNSSISYAYPAKGARIMNLKNTIKDFLPLNTAYVVTSGYGSAVTVEISGVC